MVVPGGVEHSVTATDNLVKAASSQQVSLEQLEALAGPGQCLEWAHSVYNKGALVTS